MNAEELEKFVARHETQCLEPKEPFGVECIEAARAFSVRGEFGEVVCAFANDMPDCGKPGCLFIGVDNEGHPCGMKATDELLQKFAAIRSDGNILPIPTISVDSFSLPGDVNCYNRGINMVQDELEANGNGKAEFSFRLITAFEAKVTKAGMLEGQSPLVE